MLCRRSSGLSAERRTFFGKKAVFSQRAVFRQKAVSRAGLSDMRKAFFITLFRLIGRRKKYRQITYGKCAANVWQNLSPHDIIILSGITRAVIKNGQYH